MAAAAGGMAAWLLGAGTAAAAESFSVSVSSWPAGNWVLLGAAVLILGSLGGVFLERRGRNHDRRLLEGGLETTAIRQITAPDGEIFFSNAACVRTFGKGVPIAAALQQRCREGDRQSIVDAALGAERDGRAVIEVETVEGNAGSPRVLQVEVTTLPAPGGVVWRVVDCTEERGRAVAAMKDLAALRLVLDQVPVGLYAVDAAGRFMFANGTFSAWLGAAGNQLTSGLGLSDVTALPGPDTPWDALGDRSPAGGGRVRFRGPGGKLLDGLVVQQRALRPDGGSLTCAAVMDLGREAAAAVGPEGRRLPILLDEAPLGVALVDAQGRIGACNQAFRVLSGGEQWVGRNLDDLVHPEDRPILAENLKHPGRGGGKPPQLRFQGSGERVASLFAAADEAASAHGGLVAYFVDVTEQRRLETQVAQSAKMQAVGQLAGGIAHDFNNLLTAMIGFCDLLLLRHRAGDQSFADIMQVKQNANRAAGLVRQLLAFSRQQTLQPRVLNIADVLGELSHLLRRLIGENIELEMVHGRDLHAVRVDHGQLEQVIINLAVNARDAMPEGGKLTIRTANVAVGPGGLPRREIVPEGDYVRIEVADTGTGIGPDIVDRIFEPFFSTKEVGSGTGLGLATVYGIVKQTGGFIFVDSAPAQGATFGIYLPRHLGQAAETTSRRDAEAGLGQDLTGIGTVLLVEDEDAVRLFGARALRNKGYNVLEARSGEAALEIIGSHQGSIDLMITDVVMPRMDGPTLIRRIRGFRPDMKVIFISGYAEDDFRRRLDQNADIYFLAKPFSLKQLAGKVKEVMREGEA